MVWVLEILLPQRVPSTRLRPLQVEVRRPISSCSLQLSSFLEVWPFSMAAFTAFVLRFFAGGAMFLTKDGSVDVR